MECETVDVNRLPEEARARLADEVWHRVDRHIFTTRSFASFQRRFFAGDAATHRLGIFRDEGGAMVGYISFRTYDRTVEGRRLGVIRVATGLLPEHRGDSATNGFLAREVGAYLLSKLWSDTRVVLFFTSNTPASFYGLARYVPRIYPSPTGPTPASARTLLVALAESFGLRVGPELTTLEPEMEVREDEHVARGWRDHPHPSVRFYLERCPGYTRGQSLVVLVPFTVLDLAAGMWAAACDLALKRLGVRRSGYRDRVAPPPGLVSLAR